VRRSFTAVVEKCNENGLYVGYIPGFPGAHSQGAMLHEDGEPRLESEFVGTQRVEIR
jgi:hypothetical protein